jgi:hypothetical protein
MLMGEENRTNPRPAKKDESEGDEFSPKLGKDGETEEVVESWGPRSFGEEVPCPDLAWEECLTFQEDP